MPPQTHCANAIVALRSLGVLEVCRTSVVAARPARCAARALAHVLRSLCGGAFPGDRVGTPIVPLDAQSLSERRASSLPPGRSNA